MSARITDVRLFDGSIERVVEPDWCTGVHEAGLGREDLFHEGPTMELVVPTRLGQVGILDASLTQYPFATTPAGRVPVVTVALEAQYYPFDPDGLRDLAARLVVHAGYLRDLGRELAAARARAAGQ